MRISDIADIDPTMAWLSEGILIVEIAFYHDVVPEIADRAEVSG
jgi:hypothetical protein